MLAALIVPVAVFAGPQSDRELIGQLDREVIALRQKISLLETRVAECGSPTQAPTVYPELVQVFTGGPVTVTRRGSTTLVSMPGDLLFSTGTVAVREEAGFALDLLATALNSHPELAVTLVGHTDGDPPTGPLKKLYPTNWELSYARALAVARVLTEQHKVAATRITVAGRADLDPNLDNDTPEGRAANRRVVAHLIPGARP